MGRGTQTHDAVAAVRSHSTTGIIVRRPTRSAELCCTTVVLLE